MEKNMKKNICICITESLCYRAEIKHNIENQLYFNKNFLKNLASGNKELNFK